jgi:hypothetical protein
MRKLALGVVAAATLLAAAVPAMAQVGFYIGPGGVGVDVGQPYGGYYYDAPRAYDYYNEPRAYDYYNEPRAHDYYNEPRAHVAPRVGARRHYRHY